MTTIGLRGFLPLVLGAALLLGLAGCGPSGPVTYPISGQVTWNGAPLPEGNIILEDESGKMNPDAGLVRDGQFSFQAQPGAKRVQIMATREEGPVNPVMGSAERRQYIPAQYNTETTLRAEVTSDATQNRFTFELVGD